MKSQRKHDERKSGWALSCIITLAVYAVLSALLFLALPFGPYETYDLFIANKALAGTAVILICLSFFMGPLARFSRKVSGRLYARKYVGVSGFGIAAIHAIISLGLFEKSFFVENQASFLFGVLSFMIFAAVSVTSIPGVEKSIHPKQWKFIQRTGYLAFVLVLLHFSLLKMQHWTSYLSDVTGLPSSSFVAFAFGIIVILARLSVIPLGKKR